MADAVEHRFVCGLPHGLHARPASRLAEIAGDFVSEISIRRADGTRANLRSVLSVVGLDVQQNDEFVISALGTDATAALAAIRAAIDVGLEDDEPAQPVASACRVPPVLRELGALHIPGVGVCGGCGLGSAICVGGLTIPAETLDRADLGMEVKRNELRSALLRVQDGLERRAEMAYGAEAALLRAHAQIAHDPALREAIEQRLQDGKPAVVAVAEAAEHLAALLREAKSAYVRERAVDVADIAMQVIEVLVPGGLQSACPALTGDSVVFADMLTPSQLLGFDRRCLKGLVLGGVGHTSHTVILARGMGVPCIIEVSGASSTARSGEPSIVDGDGGFAITPINDEVRRFYTQEGRVRSRRQARVLPIVRAPATTSDGAALEVGVTAVDAADVARAIEDGADGVGLYRTESLYLERDSAPREEDQREIYSSVLDAAGGKPVIFRTFDIGGDKPAPYMRLPSEANPFLGVRGIRLYERYSDLLDTQIRAMVAAAAGRPLKIMAPMVATVSEMAWFRDRVRQVSEDAHVGMMVEVPAVALSIDRFAEHADFVSIGTNDLCQYWMAADRGNPGVSSMCDELQPTFLRALRRIVDDTRASGLWVGVCGEMGGRPSNVPLMLGLGVDEVSAGPNEFAAVKLAVREADALRCRQLLDEACELDSADAVRELLGSFAWRSELAAPSVIDPECVDVGVAAASKAEAIKAAVDLLAVAGRTDAPRELEEAVWAREATYSTGLGHGFAVPHCKSPSVRWPTLAAVRLAEPVEWESMDGKPVHTVLLLAVPDGEAAGGGRAAHLKIFATLARRLVHDEFRQKLQACTEAPALGAILQDELGLGSSNS